MKCNATAVFYSLRMFAVFSVVISISGSVKYSDATHLPFSDPVSNHKRWKMLGLVKDQSQWCMKKHTKIKRARGSLQSCSQVTIMFCDSYDSKGRKVAICLFSDFCSLTLLLFLCVCHCVMIKYEFSHSLHICIYMCYIFLPATKQTLQRPEWSAIFTSWLWFCCRMIPSTIMSQ